MSRKAVTGWHGRGLRLDLSAGRTEVEAVDRDESRDFLGGRGLGALLLLSRGLWDADPLSSANPLVFAPGPLTDSGAPAAGRFSVSSRSPLTGTIFDGNSGGSFGAVLRRLGYDYLWVEGSCQEPSYVLIDGSVAARAEEGSTGAREAGPLAGGGATIETEGALKAEMRPAGDLWGLDTRTALDRLRQRYPGSEAAVIGPAGEHGVLFASIVNNRGRSIGRGGLGAVMGAKNLKAIVLTGAGMSRPGAADPERFASIVRETNRLIRANPVTSQALPDFGTAMLVNVLNEAGAFPTRNFRESQFEEAEQISGEALRKSHVRSGSACRGCPIGCARRAVAGAADGGGPEYETLWALGADCGVGDIERVLVAARACNTLGLDTISAGATIACAMELTEEGLLDGGPRFGDGEALAGLVHAIAYREGLGDELADGSRRLTERYARPELAMQVKGLELPAYDPRGMKGQGLAYATSNRGGCHLRANMLGPEILGVPMMLDRFATAGKAGPLIHLQNLNAVLDSLVICKFVAFAMDEGYFARLLSAVVGETVEPDELLRSGERIWNAERLFNLKAGLTRDDDDLPARLTGEPVPAGPARGQVVDLEPMLDEYYAARGWDGEGRPTPGKLAELRLEHVPTLG